jgi:hypothetical protein
LRIAALSRASELSLVAYDNNALESQFLQGWLLHDRFSMRSAFGAPYEFLWANPYQPGLSYFHVPLRLHDTRTGQLFLRSSWEEDAAWLGYTQGQMQFFNNGKIQVIQPKAVREPIPVGDATVIAGKAGMKWPLAANGPPVYFIIGLKPNQAYDVEVDDEEMEEMWTDAGGILRIASTRKDGPGARLKETTVPRLAPVTRNKATARTQAGRKRAG